MKYLALVFLTISCFAQSGGGFKVGGNAASNGAAAITLSSVTVTPVTPSVATGGHVQFVCSAGFSDGSGAIVTNSATWTSSAPSIASINLLGFATGIAAGTSTIQCQYTFGLITLSNSTVLTVSGPVLSSVTISPTNINLFVGTTQQFACVAAFNDLSTLDCTGTATWLSDNLPVTTINPAGLASGAGIGSAHITARYQGITSPPALVTGLAILNIISPTQLPNGTVNQPYNVQLQAIGGITPYSWACTGALPVLPNGLSCTSDGVISGTPTVAGTFNFTASVQDSETPPQIDPQSETIVISPNIGALKITTTSPLPSGQQSSLYSLQFAATGGVPAYSWSKTAGTFPAGTSLTAGGLFSGTPSASGTFNFTIQVCDTVPTCVTKAFVLNLSVATGADNRYCAAGNVASFGASDGPAALPQACYYTATSATPSPGTTRTVCASGCGFTTVAAAVAAAACGDVVTIKAQVGGVQQVYPTNVTVTKTCDATHYITIETDSLSSLAPEGTRISPCWVGIASLLGRPLYNCPQGPPIVAMPKLITNIANSPVFLFSGASFFRLIGLEITTASTVQQTQLMRMVDTTNPNHIIFDRMLVHGPEIPLAPDITGALQVQAAIQIQGSSIAVVDSYLYDTYCLSTGTCVDSNTILAGTGSNTQATLKIVNNFMESGGECFLFGGGASPGGLATPHDIEIRRNHCFKPLQWKCVATGCPGTTHAHVIVKNSGEFKNGQRALWEGNIHENSWQGTAAASQSDQSAFQILLSPKNQNGLCPNCIVSDVTIRYGRTIHSSQAMQIISAASDTGALSLGIKNISVHDMIFDDVNGPVWGSQGLCCTYGRGIQFGDSSLMPSPDQISVIHNTFVQMSAGSGSGGFASFGNGKTWTHITIRDNIASAPIFWFSGNAATFNGVVNAMNSTNGPNWCVANNVAPNKVFAGQQFNSPWPAAADQPAGSSCLGATNLTCNPGSGSPPSCFPADYSGVGFVNYNLGNGGDYHLAPTSPYNNAGTDGKDIGANIDSVNQYTAGVQ